MPSTYHRQKTLYFDNQKTNRGFSQEGSEHPWNRKIMCPHKRHPNKAQRTLMTGINHYFSVCVRCFHCLLSFHYSLTSTRTPLHLHFWLWVPSPRCWRLRSGQSLWFLWFYMHYGLGFFLFPPFTNIILHYYYYIAWCVVALLGSFLIFSSFVLKLILWVPKYSFNTHRNVPTQPASWHSSEENYNWLSCRSTW